MNIKQMKIKAESVRAGLLITAKDAKSWTEAEAVLMFFELKQNLHKIVFNEIPKPNRIRIVKNAVVCSAPDGSRFVLARIGTAPDGKRDFFFATLDDKI